MHEFKSVAVIGLGYIGLPTGATFASRGMKVIGVDVNKHAVDTINRGEIHIIEPELDMIVRNAVDSGNLRATMVPEPADVFIVAVPTPFTDGKKPDLKYIESASRSIAPVLKKGDLVILESTSPVGATEQMAAWLAEVRPDLSFPQTAGEASDIRVAHCPERVLPGQVIRELVENDRIIGGMTTLCAEAARDLYKVFVKGECILTDARTAEMCKLTENSFRDVNIAFANELSMICDRLNINVWELIRLANRHPRVNILQPGPGVGGHCIAVDPWFIVDSAPEEAKLIRQARLVNDHKPHYVVDQVQTIAQKMNNPVIACFGLAFKANIDDLRESPSVEIARALAGLNLGRVLAVEPNIQELPVNLLGALELVSVDTALETADICVVLVDHRQFVGLETKIKPVQFVIDTKGIMSNG